VLIVTATVAAMLAANAHQMPPRALWDRSLGVMSEGLVLRLSLKDRHHDARPGFHLVLPKRPTLWVRPRKLELSIRPTPNIDGGFREFGKSWGAGIQLVSDGGVKVGVAGYVATVGVGVPLDHRLMIVLQIPLP
jgi:hypothetical protein